MNNLNFNELIRTNRINKGLTQDELAVMTNMSKNKLSAIECGRLELQEDDKELLINALNIDTQKLYSTLIKLDKLINQAFHIIIYSESGLPNIDAEITKILNSLDSALDISTVNLYLFVKAVLANNKNEVEARNKQIEKYLDTLSNNYKATYYDFYATFLFANAQYSNAIEYLNMALSCVSDNGLKGYIFYHFGYVYSEMYQSLQAYEYYQKALSIFNDSNNYNKVVYTYVALADIYNRVAQRDKAIEYLHKAMNIAKKLIDTTDIIKNTILLNLSWLYLFIGDYDNCITYSLECLNFEKTDRLYFCLAFANYKKQEYHKALDYIKIGIDELPSNNIFHKILVLLKKIIKDYAGSRDLLSKTFNEIEYNDREIKLLLLDMIYEYSNYFNDVEFKAKYGIEYRRILLKDCTS